MGDKNEPVDLSEFYIGKYPVTNEQYMAFLKATDRLVLSCWAGKIPKGKEDHPVVWVTWDDAIAFCRWMSRATSMIFRLPYEVEWEKAARGNDGHIFPWGNQPPNTGLCNFRDSGISDTTAVGSYPRGASPYGVLDMAGNIWEWTADMEHPSLNHGYQ